MDKADRETEDEQAARLLAGVGFGSDDSGPHEAAEPMEGVVTTDGRPWQVEKSAFEEAEEEISETVSEAESSDV